MKTSFKFSEEEKPLFIGEVNILGFPFQSGVAVDKSRDLSLQLSIFFESTRKVLGRVFGGGMAFGYVGLSWKDHVVSDKRYFRPAEVDNLEGDSSKARKVLSGSRGFEQLVKMMVDDDIELA